MSYVKKMLLDWNNHTTRKIVNNLNADYHIKPHRILNMIQATHMGIHLKQQQFPQGTKGV